MLGSGGLTLGRPVNASILGTGTGEGTAKVADELAGEG